MNSENIQPELLSLKKKLTASIEEAEKQRDLIAKQIEKDRALLQAINSSLALKVAQVTGGGGLAGAIREVIKNLPNDQFTPTEIEHGMLEQFPTVPCNKESVRTALWNMLSKGELRTIRKGSNQRPALYERLDRGKSIRVRLVSGGSNT